MEVCRAVYRGLPFPSNPAAATSSEEMAAEERDPLDLDEVDLDDYWAQLYEKLRHIHAEIQEKSKSINKSFGIFNEDTLRHAPGGIAHDIEGYKCLIARPYESVNRAMPGSYYR